MKPERQSYQRAPDSRSAGPGCWRRTWKSLHRGYAATLLAIITLGLVPCLHGETGFSVSTNFTLDVRFSAVFSQGSSQSRLFTADTRALASGEGDVCAPFTLDTRSSAVPNIAISGRVSAGGAGLTGAAVTVFNNGNVVGTATAGADGRYALLALPADGYELHVALAGYASGFRLLVLSSLTAGQDFVLTPLPSAPAVQATAQPVPPEQQPHLLHISSAQLKLFNGSDWVEGSPVDGNKMTVVLTHGMVADCNPSSGEGVAGWPKSMAAVLWAANVQNRANILGWDWTEDAKGGYVAALGSCSLPPVDNAAGQGLALGQALYQTFGSGYSKQVHFLGHSLGALVNAQAANYLHGDLSVKPAKGWDPSRTHVTLFDEAELATFFGEEAQSASTAAGVSGTIAGVTAPAGLALSFGGLIVGAIEDWRYPIPSRYVWVDNYFSIVGVSHNEAVNVWLKQGSKIFGLCGRICGSRWPFLPGHFMLRPDISLTPWLQPGVERWPGRCNRF